MFTEGKGPYQPGAVIIKEKSPDRPIHIPEGGVLAFRHGVGGMVKRSPGFDPEHGDWEYFYYEDPKKIETGAITSCVKCHEGAKDKDYVFGAWAPHPHPEFFPPQKLH